MATGAVFAVSTRQPLRKTTTTSNSNQEHHEQLQQPQQHHQQQQQPHEQQLHIMQHEQPTLETHTTRLWDAEASSHICIPKDKSIQQALMGLFTGLSSVEADTQQQIQTQNHNNLLQPYPQQQQQQQQRQQKQKQQHQQQQQHTQDQHHNEQLHAAVERMLLEDNGNELPVLAKILATLSSNSDNSALIGAYMDVLQGSNTQQLCVALAAFDVYRATGDSQDLADTMQHILQQPINRSYP